MLDRVVQEGGMIIDGEHIPAETIIACSGWTMMHNEDCFDDADVFRPERWIVDPSHGVTEEDVSRAHSGFNAFSSGSWSCPGNQLAMMEPQLVIARTLWRLDIRLLPGDRTGGKREYKWGMREMERFHVLDAIIVLGEGPSVQFRRGEYRGM
jgi:cytochrome P450